MKDIAFVAKEMRVSKGTKVIWTNSDSVEHYVNTDAHPSHTYYPKQNSRALKKGDTFSVTFDTPGVYPYHCSAHAASMTGSIIVES
jgi:plastocyanin